jgi:hypothetical protein
MRVPEREKALAAQQQDGAAFGEIFERHSAAVYAHCFRRTGHWPVAEDLTSLVFLEAWRRPREVRSEWSASRSAIRHWRSTCSIGCPNPRSTPSESAATSSASRARGRFAPLPIEKAYPAREDEVFASCTEVGSLVTFTPSLDSIDDEMRQP